MSRIKPTPILITRDQVDNHLRDYGVLLGDLESARALADQEIAEVRTRLKQAELPIAAQMQRIESEINYHLTCHSADFATTRTIELRFGRIGFRKVNRDKLIIRAQDIAVKALKALRLTDCIRIKEEVDKSVLAKYSDEIIAQVDGVTRPDQKELPWFEPKRESIP